MRYRLGATFTLVMVMIVATVGLVAKGPVAVEAGLVEYNAVNLGKQADPIVPAPVSYTHLDVYKRQPGNGPPRRAPLPWPSPSPHPRADRRCR